MSILDGIESRPQRDQVWALVQSVRQLEGQMKSLKHAAWAVAFAFLVAGLSLVGNLIAGH